MARAADLGHPSVVSNDAGERPTRSRRELSIATVLASEAAGGITLTIALLVAVAWATVAPESYTATITSSVHLPTISSAVISDRASLVVNLLMVVFFAGIGLEIGRERSVGALRDRATATLPVVAALGGMVGAAVVYLAGIALLGPQGASAVVQVVHQCGSGVTACHNLLAMEHAGLTGSALYPGSWSEWSSDPARPVALGA